MVAEQVTDKSRLMQRLDGRSDWGCFASTILLFCPLLFSAPFDFTSSLHFLEGEAVSSL